MQMIIFSMQQLAQTILITVCTTNDDNKKKLKLKEYATKMQEN